MKVCEMYPSNILLVHAGGDPVCPRPIRIPRLVLVFSFLSTFFLSLLGTGLARTGTNTEEEEFLVGFLKSLSLRSNTGTPALKIFSGPLASL